jgi:hypothetical protein
LVRNGFSGSGFGKTLHRSNGHLEPSHLLIVTVVLGIVRDTFQRNVAPHLKPYVFGALRWTYYKQSDVDRFAGPRPKETEGKDQ